MTLEIRTEWRPQRALDVAERLGREADERAGRHLLEASRRRVPRRTGRLAESGFVDDVGDEIVVGYRAPHARFLHAHPEWQYQAGRSGRWLDEAVDEESDDIGKIYAQTLRSGWPG